MSEVGFKWINAAVSTLEASIIIVNHQLHYLMEEFNPRDTLIFHGNIREHWKHWKRELELYLVATKKDKKENKVKSSIILSCIRPQGRVINNTFTSSQEEKSFDCNVMVQKFENFCIRRQNITLLWYKSLTYKQKEGQSFDKFTNQLKKLCV